VLAIGLLPSPALPPRQPLRARVDHVLRVTVYLQVLPAVGARSQQVDPGHELSPVVRCVLPSAGAPAPPVDAPGPPGSARLAEPGAVRRSDDRQWFSLESPIPFCHASAAVPARGAVICLTSRMRSHGRNRSRAEHADRRGGQALSGLPTSAMGTGSPVQMLKPSARICSRPSSVIFSGPHGGIHTQLLYICVFVSMRSDQSVRRVRAICLALIPH